MLMMAVNAMSEDLAYFYLNNGRCFPLPVSVLSKMEVSKLDINNIQHSDYQTQKIVTNDTTVFISLSEIDSIVFDKKEITDYPKTEKEIKESIDLSNSIASKSKQIVDSLADLGEMDINVIVEEIRKLDGVIVANADSSQSVINIIQKDGICINKLMKIDESTYIDENEEVYYKSISPKLSPSPRRIEMSQGNDEPYLAPHGQALILAPFQSSFGKYMNYFREQFEYAYDKYPIVYENHSADILKFKGDNLSKYDFLFIDTHGGCGSFMAPRSDYANGWLSAYNWLLSELYSESYTTALCSRSEYNYDFIDYYINKEKLLTWDQIFIGEEDGKLYVAMDHSFIDGYSFDGCIVFASACLAGRDKTSDTSLMKAFLDNGAALYAGFEVVINSAVCESIDTGIIGLFAHGVSFQDAKQYWINSSYLKKTVDTARKTGLYKTEELDPQRFVYRVNPKLSNSKIFLKNPYPSLYPAVVDKETIGFAWETELEGFTTYSQTIELVNFQERKARKNRFNVQFNLVNDLYVDGKLYKCANEEKSLTVPANEFSVGDHSWYVTSSLYDDENNIVCTYSSKEENFNIPEPLQSLVISQNSVVVNLGSTTTVEITSGNGGYTVSVDKPTIATVTLSGTTITIKGVAKGTAKVTVKDKSGQTAEINVNVWDNLTLSQSSVGLYPGNSTTVEITNGSGHYSVSVDKPAVATASLSGSKITIKGVNIGSAVVTVTDTSTNQTAKINVTVSSAPTLVVSNSSVDLIVGGSSTVEITSGSGSYEISNSNANVVQAVLEGAKITLTAKAEGNAVVTVKDKATGQTASVSITVKPISNLVLSQSNVDLTIGAEAIVEIVSGSGDYSVAVDKPAVATATLSGTKITIKGIATGTANVTVKDKSGQTAEIKVTVNSSSESYAVYNAGTLTFYHDQLKNSRGGYVFELNTGSNSPGWGYWRTKISKVVFDKSFAGARPTSTYIWFLEMRNLTSIEGIYYLNTSEVTNMYAMFSYCENLTYINVSNFDTKNVTDMAWMFSYCKNLTYVDISNFDMRNVTDLSCMFYECSNLTFLDASNYKTEKVTNMAYMFFECNNLTSLDISNFDTRNVTDMSCMFARCKNLTTLDVSSFKTENVTNMTNMFFECIYLTSLDISNFDTRNVTNMDGMFYECNNLTSIDVSNFDTRNVTDMSWMFGYCNRLISLDLSSFMTEKVTNMYAMFIGCEELTSLDISNFDTRNVTNMDGMFYGCISLYTLDVSNFNMAACEKSESMFAYCDGLNSLAVSFTMEYLDESACEYVGYFTPCTIIAPEGFNFGVDTSGESFTWKSGNFKLDSGNSSILTFTVNDVSFKMVAVEGGTFMMGASDYDYEALSIDKPQHQVTLSSYYIGQMEVTQELWKAVMGTNPSDFKSSNKLPVECVSWDDCQQFIAKLNNLTGETFSLPTEAQWEFAARGGNYSNNYTYSGSNSLDFVAWYNGNSGRKTHNVATKVPNELGIFDMSGNVSEWCQDYYGKYSSNSQTNPTGPSSGSTRIYRGGFWDSYPSDCLIYKRDNTVPDERFNWIGLRLAL
jgi:surface protein